MRDLIPRIECYGRQHTARFLRKYPGKAVHRPFEKILVFRRIEPFQESPADIIQGAKMRPASFTKLKMTPQDDRKRRVQRARGMTHQRFAMGMVAESRHFSFSTASRIFS